MAHKSLPPKVFALVAFLTFAFAANAASKKGDVNNDGEVNIADVNAVINVILGGGGSNTSGDVNDDGEINIADVNAIINIILRGGSSQDNHEYVDLGLPSGTLWATCNVGANAPEKYGSYFAWGENAPKNVYNWESYKWCNGNWDSMTKYCKESSKGYNGFVDNKMVLDLEDDAAYMNWGENWRMPTYEQMEELVRKCTWTWTTQNGVNGQLVTGPNGNTMFLPAAGSHNNRSLNGAGSNGFYWSRSLLSTNYAYYLNFSSGSPNYYNGYQCLLGFTVRAVRVSQNEYVDLGLPSGTLWATCNVGASSPEGYGNYFAWGETTKYKGGWYNWGTYKWCNGSDTTLTKYCTNSSYGYNGFVDNKTELDPFDDAANAYYPNGRMPSSEQIQELCDNCSWQWTQRNGVNGQLVTGPNGNTMFLPAAGYFWNDALFFFGSGGFYWSRTLDSSAPCNAYYLRFDSGGGRWDYRTRAVACRVRAVRVP